MVTIIEIYSVKPVLQVRRVLRQIHPAPHSRQRQTDPHTERETQTERPREIERVNVWEGALADPGGSTDPSERLRPTSMPSVH